MIRIAIADNNELFRKSLYSIINEYEQLEIAIEAENGKLLLESLEGTHVDIVLLDLRMSFMNGSDICEIIRETYPEIKILILTFHASHEEILKAMNKGADGYFTKDSNLQELVSAIKNIHHENFHFEEALQEIIQDAYILKEIQDGTEFSTRELEIIRLHACEYSGKEISEKLGISLRTVESHKKNLMKKVGARNFIGVILFALEMNFISWDELKTG